MARKTFTRRGLQADTGAALDLAGIGPELLEKEEAIALTNPFYTSYSFNFLPSIQTKKGQPKQTNLWAACARALSRAKPGWSKELLLIAFGLVSGRAKTLTRQDEFTGLSTVESPVVVKCRLTFD
jgi:hypothetical protein